MFLGVNTKNSKFQLLNCNGKGVYSVCTGNSMQLKILSFFTKISNINLPTFDLPSIQPLKSSSGCEEIFIKKSLAPTPPPLPPSPTNSRNQLIFTKI